MSQQYPGGFITRANVDPTSSLSNIPAPGVWTLDQALQYRQAGVWPSPALNAIEDVFSTYLYTGNGTSQTITNGINLSGQGGLVWIKQRGTSANHSLFDTLRGATVGLHTNTTGANQTDANSLTAFNSNGFSLGSGNGPGIEVNTSSATYASWTFRDQAKFFDVVTWTGNGGTSGRTITHNLGSVPGCIIVKKYSGTAEDWYVYHRSLGNTGTLQYFCILNTTAAQDTGGFGMEKASNWTATQFALASGTSALNTNGASYVAYLFAHDAGGFGPNNTDNVISCGSFTTDGSGNATINLGYEPQWLLVKRSDSATGGNWAVIDNMVGLNAATGAKTGLNPNLSNAEGGTFDIRVTSTGFTANVLSLSATYIYIAIRRGPMRPPTSGTSVFAVNFGSDVTTYTTNFPLDMGWDNQTTGNAANTVVGARLLGQGSLSTASTAAEVTTYIPSTFWQSNSNYRFNAFGADCATYAFRRAPGFFDVVCYTGTSSYPFTINHNLGVVPELMIFKLRNSSVGWFVYANPLVSPNANWYQNYLSLQVTNSAASDTTSFTTSPTSTTIPVTSYYAGSGSNWVVYLFATSPGVSKVGGYTGTGALQTINCGFTSGARFVLIKRTDATGDWWLYDSARGITSGNDPYFFLNTTAAQNTSTNYVDTTSVGFQVTAAAPVGLNANGGKYIFFAIS